MRLTARPSTKLYGYLSVATQYYSRPEFVFKIPPGAFRPPPEVASALVTLRLPGQLEDSGIAQFGAIYRAIALASPASDPDNRT